MGRFLTPIDLQADGEIWITIDFITYVANDLTRITVPCGFKTDLASVPRVFWNILPPFGKYDGAAIVHDYLYTVKIFTRKRSDDILLEAMEAEGVGWLTRMTIYWGVRFGGWVVWDGRKL